MVPFTVTIAPQDMDKNLDAKLRAELPGILRKAIDGFKQWVALGGLVPPKSVSDATDAYFAEMDTVSKFIEDCCIVDTIQDRQNGRYDYQEQKSRLYQAYQRAFSDGLSANAFAREMNKRGYSLDKSEKYRRGIQLLAQNED